MFSLDPSSSNNLVVSKTSPSRRKRITYAVICAALALWVTLPGLFGLWYCYYGTSSPLMTKAPSRNTFCPSSKLSISSRSQSLDSSTTKSQIQHAENTVLASPKGLLAPPKRLALVSAAVSVLIIAVVVTAVFMAKSGTSAPSQGTIAGGDDKVKASNDGRPAGGDFAWSSSKGIGTIVGIVLGSLLVFSGIGLGVYKSGTRSSDMLKADTQELVARSLQLPPGIIRDFDNSGLPINDETRTEKFRNDQAEIYRLLEAAKKKFEEAREKCIALMTKEGKEDEGFGDLGFGVRVKDAISRYIPSEGFPEISARGRTFKVHPKENYTAVQLNILWSLNKDPNDRSIIIPSAIAAAPHTDLVGTFSNSECYNFNYRYDPTTKSLENRAYLRLVVLDDDTFARFRAHDIYLLKLFLRCCSEWGAELRDHPAVYDAR